MVVLFWMLENCQSFCRGGSILSFLRAYDGFVLATCFQKGDGHPFSKWACREFMVMGGNFVN